MKRIVVSSGSEVFSLNVQRYDTVVRTGSRRYYRTCAVLQLEGCAAAYFLAAVPGFIDIQLCIPADNNSGTRSIRGLHAGLKPG